MVSKLRPRCFWNPILRIPLLVLLILPFLALPGRAQGEEIGLSQALDLFLRNNYDVLIHKYEIDKTYGDYLTARLWPNPSLSANAQGLDYQKGNLRRADETQITLRLDQLIELGGKRGLRANAAQAAHEAVKLSHQETIRSLLIGFFTVFYNLQLDRLNIAFARDELDRFDRTWKTYSSIPKPSWAGTWKISISSWEVRTVWSRAPWPYGKNSRPTTKKN
jgi:hypothetical protein